MTSSIRGYAAVLIVALFALGFIVVSVPSWLSDASSDVDNPLAVVPVDGHRAAKMDGLVQAIGDLHANRPLGVVPTSAIEASLDAPTKPPVSDWLKIERNSTPFAEVIVQGPLAEWKLLRNAHVNPRDVEVGPRHQDQLEAYCLEMSAYLIELNQVKTSAASADFEELMRRGAARRHSLAGSRANLPEGDKKTISELEKRMQAKLAAKLGKTVDEVAADPTFNVVVPSIDFKDKPLAYSVRNGVVFSATPKDLPNAGAALRAQRWATFEVGISVTQFFVSHGCITPREAESLMIDLLREIDASLSE